MELRWARSAAKHGVSRARVKHVIETTDDIFRVSAATESAVRDDRIVFLGEDPAGVPLEVVAIEIEDGGLLVIHAMRMRTRYARHRQTRPGRST